MKGLAIEKDQFAPYGERPFQIGSLLGDFETDAEVAQKDLGENLETAVEIALLAIDGGEEPDDIAEGFGGLRDGVLNPGDVKLHLRAVKEAGLLDSAITAWHIEFLRPVEFKTFTNVERAWGFITMPKPRKVWMKSPAKVSKPSVPEPIKAEVTAMSYHRHTGAWHEIYATLSLNECLKAIQDDPWFQP